MKAIAGAFNQKKALVGAFSVIVKTGCGTDGTLHSTTEDRGLRECYQCWRWLISTTLLRRQTLQGNIVEQVGGLQYWHWFHSDIYRVSQKAGIQEEAFILREDSEYCGGSMYVYSSQYQCQNQRSLKYCSIRICTRNMLVCWYQYKCGGIILGPRWKGARKCQASGQGCILSIPEFVSVARLLCARPASVHQGSCFSLSNFPLISTPGYKKESQ